MGMSNINYRIISVNKNTFKTIVLKKGSA